MKHFVLVCIVLALISRNIYAQFSFIGDAGIMGIKNVGGLTTGNNLDVLWGRINFITMYGDTNFSSALHLRVYPSGYGFDYISGATFDTSLNAIKTTEVNTAKLQVIQGWAQYTINALKIKIGRIPLKYAENKHFGDYAQRGTGGSYMYPGALHNATMFIHNVSNVNSQLVLGVSDKNLNKAYMLIKETITPVENFIASATFRSNFFDLIADKDAEVVSALAFNLAYTFMPGGKVYTEVGIRDIGNEGTDVSAPVCIGVSVPSTEVLDMVITELEYSALRVDHNQKEVFWALYLLKNIGKHCNIQAALYSNTSGTEYEDLCLGLFFTSSFK